MSAESLLAHLLLVLTAHVHNVNWRQSRSTLSLWRILSSEHCFSWKPCVIKPCIILIMYYHIQSSTHVSLNLRLYCAFFWQNWHKSMLWVFSIWIYFSRISNYYCSNFYNSFSHQKFSVVENLTRHMYSLAEDLLLDHKSWVQVTLTLSCTHNIWILIIQYLAHRPMLHTNGENTHPLTLC